MLTSWSWGGGGVKKAWEIRGASAVLVVSLCGGAGGAGGVTTFGGDLKRGVWCLCLGVPTCFAVCCPVWVRLVVAGCRMPGDLGTYGQGCPYEEGLSCFAKDSP